MIGKRFYQKDEDNWEIFDRGKHFAYAHSGYQAEKIINELNELVDTNRELFKENNPLKREKERYKRLSEIRDENINNRILSIKEFINNCEDEKVKNTLEDLFYSEVKEYDLAKENRKLKKDNEQLKFKLNECKEHKLFSRRQLEEENEQLKQQLKEETDRVIKLEQYVYTKLCPKSENYDEKVLSKILTAILGDVE